MALSGSVSTTNYDGRYYTFSWTATQSITNNTSTISWTLKAVGGESSWYAERTVEVVLGGSTVYSKTARAERHTGTVASGTKTVSHDSSGNASFSVSLKCAVFTSSVNCTGSGSFTLNTIPRKSTLSVANGTLDTAQTLTVTRLSTSFNHTITYKCGTASGTIVTNSTSTSISFTPPLDLAKQNTTGTSVSIMYTITTYNGSTSIGSNTYTKTCSIPSSVKPTVSLTVSEYVTNIKNIFGVYVKGLSRLSISASGTGSHSSTIKSYKITANNETFTSANATTGVLTSAGSLTITVTVTDSRGRTASASETITVYDYNKPIIEIFEGVRCDEDGTENDEGENVLLTLKGTVTDLVGNTATYKIGYKESTSDDDYNYTTLSVTALSINQTYIINNLDTEKSYYIQFVITDAIGDGEPLTIPISTVFTLVDYHFGGKGMSIGKVAELEDVLDVALTTRVSKNLLLGKKTGFQDGNTGFYVNPEGYMHIQRDSSLGNPYIAFYKDSDTTPNGHIQTRPSDNYMLFQKSSAYSFDSNLIISGRDYGVNKVLWSGSWYMNANQTATLSEAINAQPHGIVIVFSEYSSGVAHDWEFSFYFIPKHFALNHSSGGVYCGNAYAKENKYLYINDTTIIGYVDNETSGTTNGIAYTNSLRVMRYILGV